MTKSNYGDLYDAEIFFSDLYEKTLVRMMQDGRSALILGYRISLTSSEYKILDILTKAKSPISRKELEVEYNMTYSSIPVHISNINKKARPITGRKLIEGNGCEKYEISKTI